MRRKEPFLIFLLLILATSCVNSKDFFLYKEGEIVPCIYYKPAAKTAAEDAVNLFSKLKISVKTVSEIPKPTQTSINLSLDRNLKGFKLIQEKNHLNIVGANETALKKGIRYLLRTYTPLNEFNINTFNEPLKAISIPAGTVYHSDEILDHREPYFNANFKNDFRLWNNTNTIEEAWGLWGHNIGKFIEIKPAMLAVVNGKKTDEQLNFSSHELQTALEKAIMSKLAEDPWANKFMIMPYDNELVCLCDQCKALGNTKNNASPAVYALINRLANKFPKAMFFSTAYVSTNAAPTVTLAPNVGVMISTMSFPKGVILEQSKHAAEITDTFNIWKKITNHIYLWDYAINFDNYFDAYPTVSIFQKNLQFYLKNGVTGVFMHGSDDGGFAVFGDLKAYLYAKLFEQPNTNLQKEISLFMSLKYPQLGVALENYYLDIEKKALNSNKQLDIYGGISQSLRKYLNYEDLSRISELILAKEATLNTAERKAVEELLLAISFQKLEILRVNGIGESGYGTDVNGRFKLNPEVTKCLALVKKLAITTGIEKFNEAGFTISTYINYWNSRIIGKTYSNLFYKKPFRVTTALDEDYPNANFLNDGAIGFDDYYNNWLINSAQKLVIETEIKEIGKASQLQINFLFDKKHKIFPPEKIQLQIAERKYEVTLNKEAQNGMPRKIIPVIISFKITQNDGKVRIEITKQAGNDKKSIAVDEIIFN